jgi:hypothetical protein
MIGYRGEIMCRYIHRFAPLPEIIPENAQISGGVWGIENSIIRDDTEILDLSGNPH